MSSTESLTVRRLKIDLKQGFPRHWNNGDAFTTAFFNALSMSFPVGEQFFIDSVRSGEQQLGQSPQDEHLRANIKKFIGQEATHRFLHGQYNDHLSEQGLHNTWADRALKQREKLYEKIKNSPQPYLHELALTAAYEHITAVLGNDVMVSMNQPHDLLSHAHTPLQTLWRWHAAEEMEHRDIAFDLYLRLGGDYQRRIFWFVFATLRFMSDAARQTVRNLWDDKTLHHPSTWWSGLRFVFGLHGFIRRFTLPLLAYLQRDFHPKKHGNDAMYAQWLSHNQAAWQALDSVTAQSHHQP
jgi:predicted metal-dependent hydrolase